MYNLSFLILQALLAVLLVKLALLNSALCKLLVSVNGVPSYKYFTATGRVNPEAFRL